MTVPIYCKEKRILKIQNRIFDALHIAITQNIEDNNLDLPKNILLLLNKTDQGVYGPGGVNADIAEYLKTKKEVLLYSGLVSEAIKKEENSFKKTEGALEALNNFHQELLNYARELE